MAKGLDHHTVSLTKNGYQKLNGLISKYASDDILAHLGEISLNRAQALKMLAGNENTGRLPEVWDTVKNHTTQESDALLAISIIFSHKDFIEVFKNATGQTRKGRIRRDSLESKTYTNLAYALNELGIASDFEPGTDSVGYSWKNVFEKMDIGPLVKEVIMHQLIRMGWEAPDNKDPFTRTFYEQSTLYGFNEVFGLSSQEFEAWLEGEQISPVEFPAVDGPTDILIELSIALQDANLKIDAGLQKRFIASLLTKPFVILTGLAGSGKTKLAQAFAYWICENVSQICIVPVGADWTNREPLLGYPNAIDSGMYIKPDNGVLDLILEAAKAKNAHKPYFLILDEMNLSHVERYFADFLSAMESNEAIPLHPELEDWKDGTPKTVLLPPNLFIIGTVNVDETTYMFSPKVLDRAQVIEFRITHEEMSRFLNESGKADLMKLKFKAHAFGLVFVQKAKASAPVFQNEELNRILLDFFKVLKSLGAEFGYRTASEIYRFAGIMDSLANENGIETSVNEIIDAAIMQKLLPKVHGSKRKLEKVLKSMAGLCLVNSRDLDNLLKDIDNIDTNSVKIKYPLSLVKIISMLIRVNQNGFTSYAEA